jgi:hypothetical protein
MGSKSLLASLMCLVASGCVMNKLDSGPTTVDLQRESDETPVLLSVTRGPQWTNEMKAGPLVFNLLPQIVVWGERPDGTLVDTLYITGADYGAMRHAGKQEGESFWRECFPTWSRLVEGSGQKLPSKEAPWVDGVSGATPHDSYTVHTSLPAAGEELVLFAEVNKSGDYNAAFTEEDSDWVGQPSVVYSARIPVEGRADAYVLEPLGRGVPGVPVDPELGDLDTALEIVEQIEVRFP